jgi:hypothetical protein
MMRSAAAAAVDVEKNATTTEKSADEQQHYSFIGKIRLKLVISVSWLLLIAVNAQGASTCK